MEEIIIKYLKKDNELLFVKNFIFVKSGYFTKTCLLFGISEIDFKEIFYKFYEFNKYIIFDLTGDKITELISDLNIEINKN